MFLFVVVFYSSSVIPRFPMLLLAIYNTTVHHAIHFLQYTKCNIPGPGTPVYGFTNLYEGCPCRGKSCDSSECQCLQMFEPSYTLEGKIMEKKLGTHSKPVLECNGRCTCSKNCQNRVVQKGINYHLEVFQTPDKGFGLRVLEDIPKYRYVCEYAGEVLFAEEAKKRASNLHPGENFYIFALQEHIDGKLTQTYIDPSKIGNVGRFINHSCDPNLIMTPVRINHAIPSMALFAKHDIKAGEELGFSYSGEEASDLTIPGVTFKQCFCGSKNCGQILPCDHSLFW